MISQYVNLMVAWFKFIGLVDVRSVKQSSSDFVKVVTKFLWFYYYLLMSFIAFTLSGMATMALTPAPQISAVLIYFFICLWNLFSGFIIPRPVYHSLLPSFFKSIIIGSKLWNRFKTIKLCFKGITYFLNLFQRTIWWNH